MTVKAHFVSYSGKFIHSDDVIEIINPLNHRENFFFTLDSTQTIVPAMRYHTLSRICKRIINKKHDSIIDINPLIEKHKMLFKVLTMNTPDNNGLLYEDVIDFTKFYNALLDLNYSYAYAFFPFEKEKLLRLFSHGGFTNHGSELGEGFLGNWMQFTRGGSAGNFVVEYREWSKKFYSEKFATTTNTIAPIIDDAEIINFSLDDADLLFLKELTSNYQEEITSASSISSTKNDNNELTFMFNKKRNSSAIEETSVVHNKKLKYSSSNN